LAWETIIDPAPIAIKVICRPHSESNPNDGKSGKIMEAEEIIATVEEPCAVLKINVRMKGMNNPT